MADRETENRLRTKLTVDAQGGDRAAFNALATHYRPLLFALAFLRTSHTEEAEDLVQEILLKAWEKLPTLQSPTLFLPWLKAITANACTSWYRRSRSLPKPLEAEAASGLTCSGLTYSGLTCDRDRPLEQLLRREQQRELHDALLTLPEANRIALLMSVWGGASYQDIADSAAVPVTTVEGRIYRARRQLERLLREGPAAVPAAETRRPPGGRGPMLPKQPRGEPRMSEEKSLPRLNHVDQAQPLALALFTRRFSFMIDAGVSIMRALDVLTEAPLPYGPAAQDIMVRVEKGAALSEALSDRPDLFSEPYIMMIRAGEIGEILEETLRRMVKVMTKEWQLARRCPASEEPLFLLHPAGTLYPKDWLRMSEYQRTVALAVFFEIFGMLLQSGVPILRTMDTLTTLLPAAQQAGWAQVRRCVAEGRPMFLEMEAMGIFPRFVLAMTRVGEVSGSLDTIFYRLSEAFEDDLDYIVSPAETG